MAKIICALAASFSSSPICLAMLFACSVKRAFFTLYGRPHILLLVVPQVAEVFGHVLPCHVLFFWFLSDGHLVLVKEVTFPHLGNGCIHFFLRCHHNCSCFKFFHGVVEVLERDTMISVAGSYSLDNILFLSLNFSRVVSLMHALLQR